MGRKKLWIGLCIIAAVFFYSTMQHTDEEIKLKPQHSSYGILVNLDTGKRWQNRGKRRKCIPPL